MSEQKPDKSQDYHIPTLSAFDSERYNKAMRLFGSSVHIVTTDGPSGRRGLTVSSCCSLSSKPPTLLTCIYRHSANNHHFIKNAKFCINSLASDQANLAAIFAGRRDIPSQERFSYGQWAIGQTGCPILTNGLLAIECQLIASQIYSSHYILIGQVVAIHSCNKPAALMYLNRKFHSLAVEPQESCHTLCSESADESCNN